MARASKLAKINSIDDLAARAYLLIQGLTADQFRDSTAGIQSNKIINTENELTQDVIRFEQLTGLKLETLSPSEVSYSDPDAANIAWRGVKNAMSDVANKGYDRGHMDAPNFVTQIGIMLGYLYKLLDNLEDTAKQPLLRELISKTEIIQRRVMAVDKLTLRQIEASGAVKDWRNIKNSDNLAKASISGVSSAKLIQWADQQGLYETIEPVVLDVEVDKENNISLLHKGKPFTHRITVEIKALNLITGRALSHLAKTHKKEIVDGFKAMDTALLKIPNIVANSYDPTSIKGSPSYLDHVDKLLDRAIDGELYKPFKAKTRVTKKTKKRKVKKSTVYTSQERKLKLAAKNLDRKLARKERIAQRAPIAFRLQDPRGQFNSLINVQGLINALIRTQVARNMKPPALVNRTGRFANSVNVTNLQFTREGQLTAFYTYMKYPYQTFERGYRQGNQYRDPRLLIDKSIREVAATYVHARFNIQTRRM